jgi:hypothetical protein
MHGANIFGDLFTIQESENETSKAVKDANAVFLLCMRYEEKATVVYFHVFRPFLFAFLDSERDAPLHDTCRNPPVAAILSGLWSGQAR